MPDLEQSIADWREQMLAAGIQSPVPLEELETHLREEIAALLESGSCEADAFHSAVQKFGPPPAVRNEFKKVTPANTALNWKFFELLFAGFTFLFPLLVCCLAYFKNGDFAELTPGQQLSGVTAAAAFSLLAGILRLSHERFPIIQGNRIRDAIFVPVMLWLVVLAYVIMPHTALPPGQKSVASLWGLAPFGIILGWCWGFAATAARKKLTSADV